MYARTTTIHARPGLVDDGIRFVSDEVMPALRDMDGFVGLSMICQRDTGRCIITGAWRDEGAMRATESSVMPLRDRGATIMSGSMSVEEWEIAVLHREHRTADGAGVRVTWLQTDADQLDHAVDVYRMHTMPAMESVPGFSGASLFVNRTTGRACSSVVYDTMDAMTASREQVMQIRDAAVREIGSTVTEIAEFELVLAHLHVPEMA